MNLTCIGWYLQWIIGTFTPKSAHKLSFLGDDEVLTKTSEAVMLKQVWTQKIITAQPAFKLPDVYFVQKRPS